MVILYIDWNSRIAYDAYGAQFANKNELESFLNTHEDYEIHYVVSAGEDTNPSEWEKYTGLAGVPVSSRFAVDDDFISSYEGKLVGTITAGSSVSTIEAQTDAEERLVPKTGFLILRNAGGEEESFSYNARTKTETGFSFTLDGSEAPENSFAEGDTVAIPQALMVLAEGNASDNPEFYVDDSRKDEGIFGVHWWNMSDKIMSFFDFEDTESISVKAEHVILSGGEAIRMFQFDMTLRKPISFRQAATIPNVNEQEIANQAWVLSILRASTEYEFSVDGQTGWHEGQTDDDLWKRSRNSLAGGEWSDPEKMIRGPAGKILSVSANTLSYGEDPTVENVGTESEAKLVFGLPAGEAGPAAGFGTPTATAEGLPSGSAPEVTVQASGENTAKVFSFAFKIPQGPVGAQGQQGIQGEQGPKGDTGFLDTVETLDPEAPGYEAGSVVSFGNPVECYQVITTTSTGETPETAPEKFHKIAGAGEQGLQGKSDYDIWLENGNSGSEADFLEYLRGKAFSEEFTSEDIPSDGDNKGKLTFSTYGIPVSISDNEGTTYPLQFGSYSIQSGVVKIDMENNLSAIGKAVTGTWKVNFASGGGDDVGMEIVESSGTSFTLVNGKVYTHTLSADETLVFDTSGFRAGICATCELWLTMPSDVVSFSFPETLVWVDGSAPSIDAGNMQYVIVLRWDGERLIANLAYTVEVA